MTGAAPMERGASDGSDGADGSYLRARKGAVPVSGDRMDRIDKMAGVDAGRELGRTFSVWGNLLG